MVHAATVGLIAATAATAAQYFIGVPLGSQPDWLWTLAMVTAVPSAYLTFPLSGLFDVPLRSGTLMEVATPFGPAFRVAPQELALIALGTLVVVGLADYLANGVSEFLNERR
jgi:hypothetical protein